MRATATALWDEIPPLWISTFWKRVIPGPPEECWLWRGGITSRGYGCISAKVKGLGTRAMGAHRFAYQLYFGPIPAGQFVCHRCDNPSCVNPNHLFLGSPQDNVDDMRAKGRAAVGTKNGLAKLTNGKVRAAREAYAAGESIGSIARRLRVSCSTTQAAIYGRTWRHLPEPCQPRPFNLARRLDDHEVDEIRRLRELCQPLKVIADQFGIDPSTVSRIAHRLRRAEAA